MSREKLLINDVKSNNSEDMSNKQIEEMAKELCGMNIACKDCRLDKLCLARNSADILYNAGYRKQSEGEWTETQREWDFEPYFYIDYTCSVCGQREQDKSPFCRWCGAKMKGGAE